MAWFLCDVAPVFLPCGLRTHASQTDAHVAYRATVTAYIRDSSYIYVRIFDELKLLLFRVFSSERHQISVSSLVWFERAVPETELGSVSR